MLFFLGVEVDRAHSEGRYNAEGTGLAQSYEPGVYSKAYIEDNGTKPSEPQQREEANVGGKTIAVCYFVIARANGEIRNEE
jgi:hypothetical protein